MVNITEVSISGGWYRNLSSNQLVGIPLPATTGFSSVLANLDAEVENKGWEMEASARLISRGDWRWSSSFNISFPKNTLLSFPGIEGSPYANMFVVGESTSILKLLEYQGINNVTGQYQFKDANGHGKISILEDAQSVENIGVKFFGGLQHELKYRNIGLSFLLQFVKQRQVNMFRDMSVPGTMANQPAAFANVWSPSNPEGVIMPYSAGGNPATNMLTTYFKFSTASVGDASYVRLKNIQVNYDLPLSGKFPMSAKIYFQGQNLLTWTKYFGIDPEFLVSGYLPPLKTYSFGFQLTF